MKHINDEELAQAMIKHGFCDCHAEFVPYFKGGIMKAEPDGLVCQGCAKVYDQEYQDLCKELNEMSYGKRNETGSEGGEGTPDGQV